MRDGDDWSGITASSAVEVVVGAEEVDLASGLLWGAGVTAVAEHPQPGGRVRLRADLPDGGVAAVGAALGGRWDVVAVDVADDGLDAWREHARVVTAGRRLVVRPPWVPLGEVGPAAVVLEIDPGRTFGHGAHPTTRLCLVAVEELLDARPGAAVLDVGCGSGVLAVAAARLGAGPVVAVDIDPAAVEATGANAAANGVADRVEIHLVGAPGSRAVECIGPALLGSFDVVVANIGAAALVALAPDLVGRVAPGAAVVFSGFLDPPPPEVGEACAPLVVADVRCLDGWSALVLRRPLGDPSGHAPGR